MPCRWQIKSALYQLQANYNTIDNGFYLLSKFITTLIAPEAENGI
jgi:hypothetical protein